MNILKDRRRAKKTNNGSVNKKGYRGRKEYHLGMFILYDRVRKGNNSVI
jgi:hypothetical protein